MKPSQISETAIPQCCVCEQSTSYSDALIPRACPYGSDRQHRICPDCWWNGKRGKIAFASENASHHCPGCKKNFPLSNYNPGNSDKKSTIEIIDIEDSDSE